MKKTVYIFALLLLMDNPCFGARDIPAMIHLNKAEQPDTTGFNLVAELCSLVYTKILSGDAQMYAGPGQDVEVSGDALLAMEKQSGTRFIESPDLFIYEFWSTSKRKTEFRIEGFTFVNENRLNEKITYGFLPLKSIEKILSENMIGTNINGTYQTTFEQALLSRKYYYHLVQLGDESFKQNPSLSVKRKNEIFGRDKEIINKIQLPKRKQIVYQVNKKKYTTDIDRSNELISAFQQLIEHNAEIYFNLGGFRLSDMKKKGYKIPKVQAVIVKEVWEKSGTEVRCTRIRVQLIFEEGVLDLADISEFDKADVFVGFQSISDFIREKPFEFDLHKINDSPLPADMGKFYLEALKRWDWSRISMYAPHN